MHIKMKVITSINEIYSKTVIAISYKNTEKNSTYVGIPGHKVDKE